MLASVTEIPAYLAWLLPIVVIGVVTQFAWSSVMSIVLFKVAKADRNFERVQAELHTTTTKLLDERERKISHSLQNHAQQVTSAMDLIAKHAQETDRRFLAIAERGPLVQGELVKAVGELREFVRINAADKGEFKDFCDEVRKGREQTLQAISKLERQVVTTDDLKEVIRELRNER